MVSYGLCWTLWTLSCFGQCLGQALQFPEVTYGAIGKSAVLVPDRPPFDISKVLSIQWDFEGDIVIRIEPTYNITAPEYIDRISVNKTTFALELKNLRQNDSGTYHLMVIIYPPQQFKGNTKLEAYGNVSGAALIGPKELLIEKESYANITSVGNGTITSVVWMKDNNPLTPSSNISFSSDNRSVLIGPVVKSDSGEYQCTLSNPVSSDTAKITLVINYGPENVFVRGQNEVNLEESLSLTCLADSVPTSSFTWKFNGTETNVTKDTFTIEKSEFTHSGDYICTAWNDVTKRNVSYSHPLVVKEAVGPGGGGGLTTGAIVGIVIGVVAAVAGICGLIVYLTKSKKIPKVTVGKNKPAKETPHVRQRTDLEYADISHEPKASGEGVFLGNMNDSKTEYAQIMHEATGQPRAPPPPYENQASKLSSLPEADTYTQVKK